MKIWMRRLVAGMVTIGLVSCAASPTRFYGDRYSLSDTRLCRTVDKAAKGGDSGFLDDARAERDRRGLTAERCHHLEVRQVLAIGAVAAAATAVVIIAHNNRHGSGGGGGGGSGSGSGSGSAVYVDATIYDSEWDWDQFFRGGQLVWECRGVQTGQFAPPPNCFGLAMTDWRWPDK
jgi:hypothetical protein